MSMYAKALCASIFVILLSGFACFAKDPLSLPPNVVIKARLGDVISQYTLGNFYYQGKYVQQDYVEAVKWYRKAAKQGHKESQGFLGYFYDQGLGMPMNIIEAIKWYRKAANQGDAISQHHLCFFYFRGQGVQNDKKQAADWCLKAAEQGNRDAQGFLGYLNFIKAESKDGVPQDYVEAAKWYRKAAEQGDTLAQTKMGFIYHEGKVVPQNYKEAVKWYRKSRDKASQYGFAILTLEGKGGLRQDSDMAIEMLREAADQGEEGAAAALGALYYEGKVIPQNYEEAYYWLTLAGDKNNWLTGDKNTAILRDSTAKKLSLEVLASVHKRTSEWRKAKPVSYPHSDNSIVDKSNYNSPPTLSTSEQMSVSPLSNLFIEAKQGNVISQYTLGNIYYQGKNVPQDYAKAIKWYNEAAKQGHKEAQGFLGYFYEEGLGVPTNLTEAEKWYRMSANQGDAISQYHLCVLYFMGREIPEDYKQAADWCRKSAEQGNMDAQGLLGYIYAEGLDVPQDYAEAAKWYRKAADHGDAQAQAALGALIYEGKGTQQNYEEAAFWLTLAHGVNDGFGDKDTTTLLNEVTKKLSPENLVSIQKRIKKWVPVPPAPPHENVTDKVEK